MFLNIRRVLYLGCPNTRSSHHKLCTSCLKFKDCEEEDTSTDGSIEDRRDRKEEAEINALTDESIVLGEGPSLFCRVRKPNARVFEEMQAQGTNLRDWSNVGKKAKR